MSHFQTWFQQRSVYLLPDGTPVVAQYFDFDANPRWWFVEVREHGRMGMIVAAVFPNGSVWNYIFQPDRGVCIPQCSDLTIDDLRPAAPTVAVGNWVTRAGSALALLWAVDAVSDLLGAAAVLAV
jgi:hypothetical protein